MLGLNSGLLGKQRVPTTGNASGLWVPNEQSLAKRTGIWPTTDDPYFANVSLLLQMNGSNGSTSFVDSSSNSLTVTAAGASISTAQSKFGGSSAYFNGGSSLQTASDLTPLIMGSGDFTVEAFIRPSSVSGYLAIISLSSGYDTTLYIYNGQLVWYNSTTAAGTIAVDTWYHVAASRQSTNMRVFIDGALVTTGTDTYPMASGQRFTAGVSPFGGENFIGWMDEIRITKGVARYTANFTPPVAAFQTQ